MGAVAEDALGDPALWLFALEEPGVLGSIGEAMRRASWGGAWIICRDRCKRIILTRKKCAPEVQKMLDVARRLCIHASRGRMALVPPCWSTGIPESWDKYLDEFPDATCLRIKAVAERVKGLDARAALVRKGILEPIVCEPIDMPWMSTIGKGYGVSVS
jgi:hypothetical protein